MSEQPIMAKGLLKSILDTIRNMINNIPSCMSGFDVSESTANVNGDIFISERQLVSDEIKDVNDNPLTLNISIAATDVLTNKDIKLVIDGLKAAELTQSYTKQSGTIIDALKLLLGLDIKELPDDTKITSALATGDDCLLSPALSDKTTNLNSKWKSIATQLSYSLQCQCPGFTPGTINNKSYNEILSLISVYPKKCGAVADNIPDTTFKCNPVTLVLPIFMIIQDYLKRMLDSTSDMIGDKITDNPDKSKENSKGNGENSAGNENNGNPEDEPDMDALADQLINNETGGVGAMESTRINVKLKKITASSDIELLGIQTESNPGEALDVVDDILTNPDFTDLITETPQSYEICVDEEGYDVNPCEDLIVHPEETLKQLFIQAIQFSRNLHMIHWLAIGNDMEKLHIKAEELYGELDQEIDLLAELIVEKTGTIVDINKIETWNTVGTHDKTFQQGIECIKQYAQSFIDYIDITYPNQPSDVQSILDDWLRYWYKQTNYFITREQEI